MSADAAEVMRRLLAAYESDGVEGLLELISPDFEGVVPPELSAEPDTYRGHDGVRRWFGGFEGFLEDLRMEADDDFIVAGDRALVPMVLRGRGAGSGIEVEQRAYQVWTVRDGKVTRVDVFRDEASARAALGL
jgi:ketosteroid isomerase-like protein